MGEIELLVGLNVPDTTAITAFHTLKRMGFSSLNGVKRREYYCFAVDDSAREYEEKLGRTDILVNANKHSFVIGEKGRVIAPAGGETGVLVTEKDDFCSGILSVLRERLGFTAIYSMRKGTLWLLAFERQDKAQAREIAERLLCSRHYQQYEVV